MDVIYGARHRSASFWIAIVDINLSILSTGLGLVGVACLAEIFDLFEVENERLKVAAWMLSFIINALQLTAAFSLLRGSLKGESFASIQYCCYWFSMSMFIIIMLSIQFFFSFRSSFHVLLYYLAHIIFRAVGMLHVHEYIEELENFTGSRYTAAVAMQVPSSSNNVSINSNFDKNLDRSPDTSIQFA